MGVSFFRESAPADFGTFDVSFVAMWVFGIYHVFRAYKTLLLLIGTYLVLNISSSGVRIGFIVLNFVDPLIPRSPSFGCYLTWHNVSFCISHCSVTGFV